jgi:hypothetical protein
MVRTSQVDQGSLIFDLCTLSQNMDSRAAETNEPGRVKLDVQESSPKSVRAYRALLRSTPKSSKELKELLPTYEGHP